MRQNAIRLFPEPRTLGNAKPVLFVDHHQSKILKLNRIFNQRMRADQNIKLTFPEFLVQRLTVAVFS
jgi:hypothetical protein